jgi:hypothetical protein
MLSVAGTLQKKVLDFSAIIINTKFALKLDFGFAGEKKQARDSPKSLHIHTWTCRQ